MSDYILDVAHCYGRVLGLVSLARMELQRAPPRVDAALALLKDAEAIERDRKRPALVE